MAGTPAFAKGRLRLSSGRRPASAPAKAAGRTGGTAVTGSVLQKSQLLGQLV
jgi:hypothetical protein